MLVKAGIFTRNYNNNYRRKRQIDMIIRKTLMLREATLPPNTWAKYLNNSQQLSILQHWLFQKMVRQYHSQNRIWMNTPRGMSTSRDPN